MAKKDDVAKKVDWYQSHRPALTKVILRALIRGTKEIEKRMTYLLDRYQEAGGFSTRTEAQRFLRQPLTASELSDLYKQAGMLPDGDLKDRVLQRLTTESYRYGWTRQKAIRETVEMQTHLIVENTLKNGNTLVKQLSLDAFGMSMYTMQKTANMGFALQPSASLIEKSITSTFNATKTVGYVRQVTYAMREAFTEGIMAGKSTNDIATEISKANHRDVWVSKAYARTMLCEVSNEVEKNALEDAGLELYEYTCTLDEVTCPVCGGLDGRVFKLKDAQAGINFPPMHRNCRCTTSPALTDEAKDKITRTYSLFDKKGRRQYDDVPRSMTYNQWSQKYYPLGAKNLAKTQLNRDYD